VTRVNLNDCGATYEATEVIVPIADARARWAVRVLDAWAPEGYAVERKLAANYGELFRVTGAPDSCGWERTRDAARLAAAEAIWGDLPADVRAQLGERP
jgi:hypothetical protein